MIYYVAHPLGTGEARKTNLALVKRWLAWLWYKYPEDTLCCPWIPLAEVMPDHPEIHKRGLSMDLEIIRRCDGLLLCGEKLSPGMNEELMEYCKGRALQHKLPVIKSHLGSQEPPNDA